MLKYLFVFLFSVFSINTFAQINKSQVLVYGDSEASWAAAVQSARSGVKTLWLRSNKDIGIHFSGNKRIQIMGNNRLDSGLWAEFLQKTKNSPSASDSISIIAKQDVNPQIARNVFESITDTLKNLSILYNVEIKSIRKSRKNWRVALSSNHNLKVDAIVDGSDNAFMLTLINKEDLSESDSRAKTLTPTSFYENNLFRTGVIVFEGEGGPNEIPASLVLSTRAENVFIINQSPWLKNFSEENVNHLPMYIQSGQAIGASAAYCAFFKTTTDKINIRTLQGELLAYFGKIIPFQDIELNDPHFSAIQRVGATGVLKGETDKESDSITFQFNPKKTVSPKEIEPVIVNLYTRSQIWFSDKNIENLNLNDLLSLIKFTALKGEELDADVKKGWTQRFHFTGNFNLEESLTRRQVAVLIDYYLKPFNVKVDDEGVFRY